MGRNKVKLNVRVTPSKKEEWTSKLDEGEFLNEVVRRGVDRELNDEYVHVSVLDEVESQHTTNTDTEDITNELNELRTTVQTLSNQIQSLQQTTPTSDDTDDAESIEDLALRIIDDIPARAHDFPQHAHGVADDADDRERIRTLIEGSQQTSDRVDGRAERIAALNDTPVPRVREALNYLEHSTTERVKSAILEDARHWVRI